MPRPCKSRRICAMPSCSGLAPKGAAPGEAAIDMTLDEYEAIRLIDLEGMSQEACAERMKVARTTAQAIYNSARVKLARCLVQGCELHIRGGEYVLCDGHAEDCGCGHCSRDGD